MTSSPPPQPESPHPSPQPAAGPGDPGDRPQSGPPHGGYQHGPGAYPAGAQPGAPSGPAPAGKPVPAVLGPLRDLAAYALVGAPAIWLFVAVIRLIPSGVGQNFATRAQDSFYSFVNLETLLMPLAAVLLAHLIKPVHRQARIITIVALVEYAVAAFFAAVFGFLFGVVNLGTFSVRVAFEEFLVRAAWLAVFGLAAYATYLIWRNAYYAPRPKPVPGTYGTPQQPWGQQQYGQPGYPPPGQYPGQPGLSGQPGPFQPGSGQPGPGFGQPGPAFGQPGPGQPAPGQPPQPWGQQPAWGQPPAGNTPPSFGNQPPAANQPPPGWGQPPTQPPTSAPPASAHPAPPASAPPGPYAPEPGNPHGAATDPDDDDQTRFLGGGEPPRH